MAHVPGSSLEKLRKLVSPISTGTESLSLEQQVASSGALTSSTGHSPPAMSPGAENQVWGPCVVSEPNFPAYVLFFSINETLSYFHT